jgi:hypothetical protein
MQTEKTVTCKKYLHSPDQHSLSAEFEEGASTGQHLKERSRVLRVFFKKGKFSNYVNILPFITVNE